MIVMVKSFFCLQATECHLLRYTCHGCLLFASVSHAELSSSYVHNRFILNKKTKTFGLINEWLRIFESIGAYRWFPVWISVGRMHHSHLDGELTNTQQLFHALIFLPLLKTRHVFPRSERTSGYLVHNARFQFMEWFRMEVSVQAFVLIHSVLWRWHCIERVDHPLEGDLRLLISTLQRGANVLRSRCHLARTRCCSALSFTGVSASSESPFPESSGSSREREREKRTHSHFNYQRWKYCCLEKWWMYLSSVCPA